MEVSVTSTKLRGLRLSADVSQGLLSKESGITRQRLSYAECDYLSLSDVEMEAVHNALRRIVERRMSEFQTVLQAV
jgi:transcriptional regulator with XRE-family HTH domain